MFDALIANLKHKANLAVKSTIGLVVAFAAILVALGFFCAALFLWLAGRYGAITAALVLGGAFVFLALIALIVVALMRHRKPPAPPPAPPRKAAWWADPTLLSAALDVSRALGRRRVATAALMSAFVFGLMLRPFRKHEDESAE